MQEPIRPEFLRPDPIWMEVFDAILAHDRDRMVHGGAPGMRDAGLLESALMRPRNLWLYSDEQPSWAAMAAAYAFGISSNHPFVDGNKRTALLVSFIFLETNGIEVIATQEDAYLTMLALAAGELSESELAAWFQSNTAAAPQ